MRKAKSIETVSTNTVAQNLREFIDKLPEDKQSYKVYLKTLVRACNACKDKICVDGTNDIDSIKLFKYADERMAYHLNKKIGKHVVHKSKLKPDNIEDIILVLHRLARTDYSLLKIDDIVSILENTTAKKQEIINSIDNLIETLKQSLNTKLEKYKMFM